jgi:hypothetical protein
MADKNIQNNKNSDSQELVAFLTKRFDGIDQKFSVIDKRFEGIEKQSAVFQNQYVADYKELVGLMVSQFEEVYEKLDQKANKAEVEMIVKTEVDKVMGRIVQLNDKINDYRTEEIGLKRQVEKHEKWHFQTAAKVGIKLLAE